MVGVALMVRATTGLAITPAVGAAGVGNGKVLMRFNKENISHYQPVHRWRLGLVH